jgi:hypothetical protein
MKFLTLFIQGLLSKITLDSFRLKLLCSTQKQFYNFWIGIRHTHSFLQVEKNITLWGTLPIWFRLQNRLQDLTILVYL